MAISLEAQHAQKVENLLAQTESAVKSLYDTIDENVRKNMHDKLHWLLVPLYIGTSLEEKKNTQINILRKNIYFIARKMKNCEEILIQLVQRGVVHPKESQEMFERTDNSLLLAINVLKNLISKDIVEFNKLNEVLEITENAETKEILENAAVAFTEVELFPEAPRRSTRSSVRNGEGQPKIATGRNGIVTMNNPDRIGGWNCNFCTFLNAPGETICLVCYKTQDLYDVDLNNGSIGDQIPEGVINCLGCTFTNDSTATDCIVCQTPL